MTCRKNGWSLDRSTLYTKVTKFQRQEDVTERPSSGALVYGLYLEGGAWNLEKSCLERQKPKQLVQELPVLQIIPIESHKLKLQNTVAAWHEFQNNPTSKCIWNSTNACG